MSNRKTDGVHLWLVLMKAHQALHQHAMRSIAGTGLCFSDFAFLEMLLHKGPLPVNTLGAKRGAQQRLGNGGDRPAREERAGPPGCGCSMTAARGSFT